jgi:Domain of unknown function (DUF4105)
LVQTASNKQTKGQTVRIAKLFLIVCGLFLASSGFAGTDAGVFEWSTTQSLSSRDENKITQFLLQLQTLLPPEMVGRLTHGIPNQFGVYDSVTRYPIKLEFVNFPAQSPVLNSLTCPSAETMADANERKAELQLIIKARGLGDMLRYHDSVEVAVVQDKTHPTGLKVQIHAGFIPVILAGPGKKFEFACEHRNFYETARAAVIHGISRIYDQTQFRDQGEIKLVKGDSAPCASVRQYAGNQDMDERMKWDINALKCIDIYESSTLLSERVRYRTLANGWSGTASKYQTTKQVLWPRATSPFAYAYDARTHFAYSMEFFLLDPQFACRQPLIFEYLSHELGTNGVPFDPYHAYEQGICKVNTKVRVPQRYENDAGTGQSEVDVYDLHPDNIDSIYYYRAGAGDDDISAMFGHSMYRVVAKKGGAMIPCPDEANGGTCDVVITHRANPLEMKMDKLKGVFGGYPAQLLLKDVYDILQEYGDDELRHIYNIPLGQTVNGHFTPMNEDQKEHFLLASLEEYWAYIGNYKYISNNCANEAMRLYQISSDDPRVAYSDNMVLPKSVDEKVLGPLGLADESAIKGIVDPGLLGQIRNKIFGKSQQGYEKQRKAVESDHYVDESKKYGLYDALSDILRREDEARIASGICKNTSDQNQTQPQNNPCSTGKYDNINRLDKEFKNNWVQLATVSKDQKQLCKDITMYSDDDKKQNHVEQILKQVKARFNNLYDTAKKQYQATGDRKYWDDMYEINREFYFALYLVERKRSHELTDLMVGIAYDIARPSQGKEKFCKKGYSTNLTADQKQERIKVINSEIDSYEELQHDLQPYSKYSVIPGYGIPLESELMPVTVLSQISQQEAMEMDRFMQNLRPELGMDYWLYSQVRGFRKDLCELRVTDNLVKDNPPKCACIFPDMYSDAQIATAGCSPETTSAATKTSQVVPPSVNILTTSKIKK